MNEGIWWPPKCSIVGGKSLGVKEFNAHAWSAFSLVYYVGFFDFVRHKACLCGNFVSLPKPHYVVAV